MVRALTAVLVVIAGFACVPASQAPATEFEAPVRIQADGQWIDVEVGHAAPYVYDFNRDGKRDLLVGQFGQGKLRIYRNLGSDAAPKYGAVEWLHAEGEIVTTPTG